MNASKQVNISRHAGSSGGYQKPNLSRPAASLQKSVLMALCNKTYSLKIRREDALQDLFAQGANVVKHKKISKLFTVRF